MGVKMFRSHSRLSTPTLALPLPGGGNVGTNFDFPHDCRKGRTYCSPPAKSGVYPTELHRRRRPVVQIGVVNTLEPVEQFCQFEMSEAHRLYRKRRFEVALGLAPELL